MHLEYWTVSALLILLAPSLAHAGPPDDLDEPVNAPADESPESRRALAERIEAEQAQALETAKKSETTAKQAVEEAKLSAAVAQQTAAEAGSRAQDAQASFDLAKSGKLMSSGVTAGLAMAVQTPLWGQEQKTVDTVAMPYLMVLPGYFLAPQPLREYCAAAWGIGDDSGATAAAVGAARKAARVVLDAIEADLKSGRSDTDVITAWFPDARANSADRDEMDAALLEQRYAEAEISTIKGLLHKLSSPDPTVKTDAIVKESEVLDSLTFHQWNPTLRGKCTARSFGVWIGRPFAYTTATKVSSDANRVDRELAPVVSFGVGYTPHAYLSFLAGVTLANVEYETDRRKTFWVGTFALGGNLDLLGNLFK